MSVAAEFEPVDGASDGLVPLAHLSLDAAETSVLITLRYVNLSETDPARHAWDLAFAVAVERWDAVTGPQIAWAGASFVKALRRAVPRQMGFADPLDLSRRDLASADEMMVMRMLRAMRQDVTPEARRQMVVLTGGRIDPQLVKWGLQLARLLPSYAAGGVMSRPSGPSLRLVH